MMFAVITYETQPGGSETVVFGVQTAIADPVLSLARLSCTRAADAA